LDKFYESLGLLFSNLDKKYDSFTLALLIQNTQWRNDRKVEPHAFKLFGLLTKYLDFENHVIVPYSTQQYNAQQVNIAKEEKIILVLHRDLLVFKK